MLEDGSDPMVILLDLRMPGMEFRRAQMGESRLARIPVVVMTALGGDHDSTKAQMGDVLWLAKPFDPEALADTIAQARSKRLAEAVAVPVALERLLAASRWGGHQLSTHQRRSLKVCATNGLGRRLATRAAARTRPLDLRTVSTWTGVGRHRARVRRPADFPVHGAVDERQARRAVGLVLQGAVEVAVRLGVADEKAVVRLTVGHAR